MELKVLNIEGKETGRTVELNDSIFGVEPNTHVVWLDVKQFLANQRQGTHDSKEKSMLSGSTRKLHKQKGGGGARIGSIKSPLFPGGARVFGPHPRDYHFKLNKKMKRLARISALSAKAAEQSFPAIEGDSEEQMEEYTSGGNIVTVGLEMLGILILQPYQAKVGPAGGGSSSDMKWNDEDKKKKRPHWEYNRTKYRSR